MKYFAKIKYLGSGFHGFQVQPDKRTVQGELSRALFEAFGSETKVTGCSRTDAGVHANEFCVLIENENATVPPEKLPVAVARFMPCDLSLFYAEEAKDGFHPRYDVVSKEYLYKIKNLKVYDPFDYGRVWFLPRPITEEALKKMRVAAEYIVGTHDFSSFMSEGSDVVDTVRTVFSINITRKDELFEIRISADGFLYNMVRIIVGTLVEVAYGNISSEEIPLIIESKNRNKAGMTAPPDGLYLNKVYY
jgi:tRNA pseudouridine38-40 synthase